MICLDAIGFSIDSINEYIEKGLIRAKRHSELPYTIYNYTEKTQYEKQWDDVTLNCRGLIVSDDGEIIARPFKKFFNFQELDITHVIDIFNHRIAVLDKLDGSLGILYKAESGCKIATRGSFDSEQAKAGTSMWESRHAKHCTPNDEYTFLFEIIYPENRIVVDYGNNHCLVLLGAVKKRDGVNVPPSKAKELLNWNGECAEEFDFEAPEDVLGFAREGKEGLVVMSTYRAFKVKQEDYVRLHKLKEMFTKSNIFKEWEAGKTALEVCEGLPDEFHGACKDWFSEFNGQFNDLKGGILKRHMDILEATKDRKEFAKLALKEKHSKAHFMLYDAKDCEQLIKKIVGETLC